MVTELSTRPVNLSKEAEPLGVSSTETLSLLFAVCLSKERWPAWQAPEIVCKAQRNVPVAASLLPDLRITRV